MNSLFIPAEQKDLDLLTLDCNVSPNNEALVFASGNKIYAWSCLEKDPVFLVERSDCKKINGLAFLNGVLYDSTFEGQVFGTIPGNMVRDYTGWRSLFVHEGNLLDYGREKLVGGTLDGSVFWDSSQENYDLRSMISYEGNIYFSDYASSRVGRLNPDNGDLNVHSIKSYFVNCFCEHDEDLWDAGIEGEVGKVLSKDKLCYWKHRVNALASCNGRLLAAGELGGIVDVFDSNVLNWAQDIDKMITVPRYFVEALI